jgi:hypothetical protein
MQMAIEYLIFPVITNADGRTDWRARYSRSLEVPALFGGQASVSFQLCTCDDISTLRGQRYPLARQIPQAVLSDSSKAVGDALSRRNLTKMITLAINQKAAAPSDSERHLSPSR